MQSYLDDDSRKKREKQTSDTQFIGFFPSFGMLSNLCRNITKLHIERSREGKGERGREIEEDG